MGCCETVWTLFDYIRLMLLQREEISKCHLLRCRASDEFYIYTTIHTWYVVLWGWQEIFLWKEQVNTLELKSRKATYINDNFVRGNAASVAGTVPSTKQLKKVYYLTTVNWDISTCYDVSSCYDRDLMVSTYFWIKHNNNFVCFKRAIIPPPL